MQLQIKTLSNEKFTIECELTDTVIVIIEFWFFVESFRL